MTLNSTVGLQALHHGAPVLTLGDCVYAVPGLVAGGTLDTFWRNPGTVDKQLYARFRSYLVRHTQLNASFYGEAPVLKQTARIPSDEPGACVESSAPAGIENEAT